MIVGMMSGGFVVHGIALMELVPNVDNGFLCFRKGAPINTCSAK